MEEFELSQIWVTDPQLGDLEMQQYRRMDRAFGTVGIPLHVILDPRDAAFPDGRELARIGYTVTMTPDDYAAFLEKGLDAYRRSKADTAKR